MQTILVAEDLESWSFISSNVSLVEAHTYLSHPELYTSESIRVVNACRSYKYQSVGYYVSLLAAARLHHITPSISQIQDTLTIELYQYISQDIEQAFQRVFINQNAKQLSLNIYFGKNSEQAYAGLVEKLHGLFPIPLLRIDFIKTTKWAIKTLVPLSIEDVPVSDIAFMQESAIKYFDEQSPKSSYRKNTYNVAMLIDPEEGETAPSNMKALEQFVSAGEQLGLNVSLVTQKENITISKFDALFIRTTTSVNHYTYQLARCAAKENLVVIDDPQSIIMCTNKVFQGHLFDKHQILTPPTQFLNKYDTSFPPIQFPCVLKRPDSSCSQGVVKIENMDALKTATEQFFKTSDILLVQSFIPTEFDWRIGIMDNKPLYACRYYMAKDHWQIVNWNNDDRLIHDAVPIDHVPKAVMALALKSTRLIGNGLYGVDIKSFNNEQYIIEVNDNPSINFGIEDALLNNLLYENIMNVFLQRLCKTGGTQTTLYNPIKSSLECH